VGGPFADFEADQTSILTGEGVTFTDLSINNPDSWSWRFFGGSPGTFNGQEPPAIIYNNTGSFNVRLSVSNDMGTHVLNKSSYIVVGAVNLDEPDQQYDVKVFPNPSDGVLFIELNSEAKEISVKVNNSIGERIYDAKIQDPDNRISVDISDHPAGVYMMMIKIDGNTYLKKITLAE
jgi:PKD repeat protein